LCPYLEIIGEEKVAAHSPRGAILALGHFGNFELYAHTCSEIPGMQRAATYRGLKQQRLDGLVRRLRDESGCRFFDRRREARALKSALREDRLALGLLSDLHGGRKGLNLRFFNQECSVSPASALFALRYDLPLYTAICFRVGLARWRIEIGDEIPTRVDGRRRRVHELMAEIMSIFETAVRRDPANWFWVHDRWRFVKRDRAANLASCLPVTDPSVSHGQDLPESSRAKYAGGR
jgi:KDO2-lipid IV(A) lauroyltransferase